MHPRAPGSAFDRAVQRIPLLRCLRASQLDRLRPCARLRRLGSWRTAWREGDPAGEYSFLVSGVVKLVKAGEAGREAVIDLPAAGQLLCCGAVACHAPYCCSATAQGGPVEVLSIPRRDFLHEVERDAALARALVRETGSREVRLASRIAELSSGQLARRIALLLLRLARESGVAARGGAVRIPIALRRQDLADLCGVRLETAIRAMRGLGRRGAVRSLPAGFLVKPAILEGIVRNGR